MILHVISQKEWKSFNEVGIYKPTSLSEEGFIHCATLEQVAWVGNTFYKNQKELLLLVLDESKVESDVIFEDLYELGQEYPHIYGPLRIKEIQDVLEFKADEHGKFHTPNTLNTNK